MECAEPGGWDEALGERLPGARGALGSSPSTTQGKAWQGASLGMQMSYPNLTFGCWSCRPVAAQIVAQGLVCLKRATLHSFKSGIKAKPRHQKKIL